MQVTQRRAASYCTSLCRRRRRLPPLSTTSSAVASFFSALKNPQTPISYDVSSLNKISRVRQYHTSHSILSDNLLGHSPMARSVPTTSQQSATAAAASSPGSSGPSWGVSRKISHVMLLYLMITRTYTYTLIICSSLLLLLRLMQILLVEAYGLKTHPRERN